jgi:hypothetical protein
MDFSRFAYRLDDDNDDHDVSLLRMAKKTRTKSFVASNVVASCYHLSPFSLVADHKRHTAETVENLCKECASYLVFQFWKKGARSDRRTRNQPKHSLRPS